MAKNLIEIIIRAKNEAEAGFKSVGQSLQDVGSKIAGIGAGLTAGLTAPLAGIGLAAVNAASDLEESMSKVGVVFGDAAWFVEDFASTAATQLGISAQAALEAAGTFGNLFTAMGMGQHEAAEMSTSLVSLASDLASFNNLDPTEVLEKLRAGLTGETEPLKSLGINLNAATVAAKAMELGLVDLEVDQVAVQKATIDLAKAQEAAAEATKKYGADSLEAQEATNKVAKAQQKLEEVMGGAAGEIDAAAKAQATLALVMEQTANAQGDFARTSDGLANSTRVVKAQLQDAAASIGQMLLPVALKAVTVFKDLLERFLALSPETKQFIVIAAGIAAAVGPVLTAIGALAGAFGTVSTVIGGVIGALSGPLLLVIAAVAAAIGVLYLAWTNNWGGIQEKVAAAWATIQPILQTLWEWLQTNIPVAIQALSDFWTNTLLPAITAVWNWINANLIPLLTALAELVGAILVKASEALAGLWQNVLQPALAAVWEWMGEKLLPVVKELADWLKSKLGPAFDAISKAIQAAIKWIKDLAASIASLELPDWLTPGSPTPFELGLRGINDAMSKLAGTTLPEFSAGLNFGAQPALATSGAMAAPGGGRGLGGLNFSITINVNGGNEDVGRAAASGAEQGVTTAARRLGLI